MRPASQRTSPPTELPLLGSRGSLRRALMLGIGLPVLAFMMVNSVSLYRQSLVAADTAYDRTLLASAKAIGEVLEVSRVDGKLVLLATPSYAALEAFEADNRSRMFYKVSGFSGEMVTGFADLRTWSGELPTSKLYAALVHFYDDDYQGTPVRVAVLLQPVAGEAGMGMATIQVAETLELRHALARDLLTRTVWQQGLLLAVMTMVTTWIIRRVTRPVDELSRALQSRADSDLSALTLPQVPSELKPVVEATNELMARLSQLLGHQKRFVRDTAHQLRTPLAVLKTQVQSARRGDVEPQQALKEIEQTVTGATELANQMLALAKVEQLRHQGDVPTSDWSDTVRQVALDLAPLVADKQLDFELQAQPTRIKAHEWMLRELTRNLLHNAILHSPAKGHLLLRVGPSGGRAEMSVRDEGPGISAELRSRLFQPFARGNESPERGRSGLGLAICREITLSLGGEIVLENRTDSPDAVRQQAQGLNALVRLPAHEENHG